MKFARISLYFYGDFSRVRNYSELRNNVSNIYFAVIEEPHLMSSCCYSELKPIRIKVSIPNNGFFNLKNSKCKTSVNEIGNLNIGLCYE